MNATLDSESAISIIKRTLGNKIRGSDLKVLEQLKLFRDSDAIVYCDDCKTVFYSGNAHVVAEEKRFVDWKMLSFRHVWDTKHKVKVYLSYFGLSTVSLSQYLPYFDPQDNRIVNYYETVEEKRQTMIEHNDYRAFKSHDENWDSKSRCTCSTCGKSYYDPKDACYCCYGTKPWLPYKEVDTIMVKT